MSRWMKKECPLQKWIILGIFSSSLVWARAPGSYSQLRSELNKVSQKNLIQWVNQLVQVSSPSRMVGMPGHQKAREFLQSSIEKLDPKKSGQLSLHSFVPNADEAKRFYQSDFDQKIVGKFPADHPEYLKWFAFTLHMQSAAERLKSHQGENVVWEKTGLNPSKLLVITAHYDTISHDPKTLMIREKDPMPGANYNASGVAVALGLIQILAQIDLNYSVRVVFLDWQGVGFLGSYAYAQELKKTQSEGKTLFGIMNLEMLGQDSSFLDKTKKIGNLSAYVRAHPAEEKWATQLIQHGSQITQKVSFELRPNNFENSDNIRFAEAGLHSVTFSQNWEEDFNPKFFQTPDDTPETLNHQTLYQAYQYLGGAALGTLLDITK